MSEQSDSTYGDHFNKAFKLIAWPWGFIVMAFILAASAIIGAEISPAETFESMTIHIASAMMAGWLISMLIVILASLFYALRTWSSNRVLMRHYL